MWAGPVVEVTCPLDETSDAPLPRSEGDWLAATLGEAGAEMMLPSLAEAMTWKVATRMTPALPWLLRATSRT
jgi:hypothetical protein